MKFFERREDVDPELVKAAIELKNLLEKYSQLNQEAKVVLTGIEPMLTAIISGSARLPIEKVPYSYNFHEGNLRRYTDLEDAYSSFAVRAKRFDMDRAERFFNRLENDPKFAARMNSPKLTWWEALRSMWIQGLNRLRRHRFK